MERYYCADCGKPVEVNVHGICLSCGGRAIDTVERVFRPNYRERVIEWGGTKNDQPNRRDA